MRRMAAACRAEAGSVEGALTAVIATAAEHHRTHAHLERVLTQHLPAAGRTESGATREFQSAMRALLRAHRAGLRLADPELGLFFLRNLGRSIMHEAVVERTADLESGAIARELLRGALALVR
jgi:hypothetical protein